MRAFSILPTVSMRSMCAVIAAGVALLSVSASRAVAADDSFFSYKGVLDSYQFKADEIKRVPYELGTKLKLSFARGEASLLVCKSNPAGVKEILVGWSQVNRKQFPLGVLTRRLAFSDGKFVGEGSVLYKVSGEKPFIACPVDSLARTTICLTLPRWEIKGDRINVVFFASVDAKEIDRMLRLSADERVECFVRMWSEVKYNFAFFDQVPELDWDKVLTDYIPKVRAEQANYEFGRLMTSCVAQLRDGHTRFWGGPTWWVSPEISASPPVFIQCVEGKAIIVKLAKTKEIREAKLTLGMEITHVDGRPVPEILAKDLYPHLFASTQHALDLEAYPSLLKGPARSVASVRIRDLKGDSRTVKLTRTKTLLDSRFWAGRGGRKAGKLAGGIFYVPLDSFASRSVVGQFDKLFDQVSKSKGLILDMRSNSGGNSRIGYEIISYLTDKPLKTSRWKTRQYMPSFRAWGQKEKWYEGQHAPVQPIKGKKPFLGPVVVLTGPRTVSAGEDFLIPLHASGRATLVGQRTCGSTGQPLIVKLPGNAQVWVCTKRDTYPDGRDFVGVGVTPDVEVRFTQADVAAGRYANGYDPFLEKGLQVLRAKIKK